MNEQIYYHKERFTKNQRNRYNNTTKLVEPVAQLQAKTNNTYHLKKPSYHNPKKKKLPSLKAY
jgi:hypothetical protein